VIVKGLIGLIVLSRLGIRSNRQVIVQKMCFVG
jgi:hypothetical protein